MQNETATSLIEHMPGHRVTRRPDRPTVRMQAITMEQAARYAAAAAELARELATDPDAAAKIAGSL